MRFHPGLVLLFLISPSLANGQQSEPQSRSQTQPLAKAHAHNDYLHRRPLADALDHGFCSVEADIYLVDGMLLIGHDRQDLRSDRTLQRLYLDPLRERVRQNAGRVYRDGPVFTLLVDIKDEGEQVYQALRPVLESYKEMLCGIEDDQIIQRAVQVVISGDRPIRSISDDPRRYVGIDGRLTDLDSSLPANLMPLISDRWSAHFRWNGVGEFPPEERKKLQSIVQRTHAAGRRVRFWATPETVAMWRELTAAGVDHINTDRLDDLQVFLLRQ